MVNRRRCIFCQHAPPNDCISDITCGCTVQLQASICSSLAAGTTGAGTHNHLDSSEAGHYYALRAEGDGFDPQMCPTKVVKSDSNWSIA